LFISYATEDWPFVEWLTLRLTAEGYKVWCDRIKLLGGESYPKDIDAAIKWRAFRFLTVLSHHSIKKPNPLKERTLALNLARERNENFVVPVNLDGISPTDLDWMVSDLTFISFHLGWADGLKQLLKLLEELNAPREFHEGQSAAGSWFEAKQFVTRKQERLWLNLAEVKELPKDIYRFETAVFIPEDERMQLLKQWPHVNEGNVFWAFEYLWASGFVPRLRTYPGWEAPVPLRIDIQYGDADIEQVARDIFALTKLNYNACRFGDSEPVTIGFSDAVGEILVSNPTVTKRNPRFKYYI